ncbi:antibiotic biosynthesis monooxygenase family protein [Kiloniella litopenaei]|uniref:antibiotic biosynthesis monooxygenase family protein n=1 Tax=Kiloniella litopenaei TaxID=1549748 RepID=UPI003BAD80D4
MPEQSYCFIWEFIVKEGENNHFEDIYGAEGDWVQLFTMGAGYIRSDLVQDQSDPQRYLTVDYWNREEDFHEFKKVFGQEYSALDQECEGLTVKERKIGEFTNPNTAFH